MEDRRNHTALHTAHQYLHVVVIPNPRIFYALSICLLRFKTNNLLSYY